MRTRGILAISFVATCFGLTGALMAACVGDEGGLSAVPATDASTEATVGPSAKTNGLPCGAASECQSGQCSDGVCCDAKCDGICERCNLPSTVGTCSPIPDGTDPDKECLPAPIPDAGAPPADAGDDGGDGGDAGDAVDAGPQGPAFDLPDGGYPATTESACAGRCNGKRACAYPAADTACGPSFCGNTSHEARAVCDGQGHCGYNINECQEYACPSGAAGCKTACSAPTDCLDTHYCEGTTHICKPRLATGVSCEKGIECTSGYCIDGICCNTACDTSAAGGGSCSTPEKIGQCVCGACPGGTCQLFYRDADGDTYGDIRGTTTNGNAKFACEGAPPAGFVADHTDCFDSVVPVAKDVHPGQAGYFGSSYLDGDGHESFDYNCSGGPDKETNDTDHCGICRAPALQGVTYTAYTPFPTYCFAYELGSCSAAGQQGTHKCCTSDNNAPFFTSPVDCGKSGATYTCGTCPQSTGNPATNYAGSVLQKCH